MFYLEWARRPAMHFQPMATSDQIAKIGVVGCGNISPAYFRGCRRYDNIEIVACADINREAAKSRAEEFEVPRVLSVDELLEDDEIEIVLNITTPQFHAPINKAILEAGKHAYCEKPFATHRQEGLDVLQLAAEKELYVGCAPDTFLSGALQTARKLIDGGFIGDLFGAVAVFAYPGHESWHPNPEYYYKKGGGPLLDMGPYYLTALVNILGPVSSVYGSTKTTFEERTITSEPLKGSKIQVETPTHVNGLLEFENGATASTLFSFDMRGAHQLPMLMVYGTEGSLSLPNPNRFDGKVEVSRGRDGPWEEVPLEHHYEGMRSLGLAEMAEAIRVGRPQRANGAMAYHVFDVMSSYEESYEDGTRKKVDSTFERLPVMPDCEAEDPVF